MNGNEHKSTYQRKVIKRRLQGNLRGLLEVLLLVTIPKVNVQGADIPCTTYEYVRACAHAHMRTCTTTGAGLRWVFRRRHFENNLKSGSRHTSKTGSVWRLVILNLSYDFHVWLTDWKEYHDTAVRHAVPGRKYVFRLILTLEATQ